MNFYLNFLTLILIRAFGYSYLRYPQIRRKMTRFMIGRLLNAKKTLTHDEPIRELTLKLKYQKANPNRKHNNTKREEYCISAMDLVNVKPNSESCDRLGCYI
jgi:hypothetical protein